MSFGSRRLEKSSPFQIPAFLQPGRIRCGEQSSDLYLLHGLETPAGESWWELWTRAFISITQISKTPPARPEFCLFGTRLPEPEDLTRPGTTTATNARGSRSTTRFRRRIWRHRTHS